MKVTLIKSPFSLYILFLALIALISISCTTKQSEQDQENIPVEKALKEIKPEQISAMTDEEVRNYCLKALEKLPGQHQQQKLNTACEKIKVFPGCYSVKEKPIFHYEKESKNEDEGLRILTIGLIHGDEFPSGSVARAWMERLEELSPRSSWRIIPVANPDGLELRQRPNANGVDINRNFPTRNWEELAHKMWKRRYRSSWRKYPGPSPASEVETNCLISHINDFKPNFIISVHTPLGHLDFDGPKMKYPDFNILPWKRYGHFPGSLGRYMWQDNGVPVLTIELRGNSPVKSFDILDSLQDISGNLAIKAVAEIKEKKSSSQVSN